METIRRDLLLDALRFYQKFLDKQSDDPMIRREAIMAYDRVGNIHFILGQHQDAVKAYGNAFEMFDKLGPSAFADAPLVREMVNCHLDVSNPLGELGKREEGVQHVRRTFELADKLDKEVADNRIYIQNARNSWASVLLGQQPDEAEKILKANLALGGSASNFGDIHHLLGSLYMAAGRLAQAEEAYRQAVKYGGTSGGRISYRELGIDVSR